MVDYNARMDTVFFDGKKFVEDRITEMRSKVEILKTKGINLKLVWVQVGKDDSSTLYGNIKERAAQSLGIDFEKKVLDSDISVDILKNEIITLNDQSDVTGLMVQLPVKLGVEGKNLRSNELVEILNLIDVSKDVDCLTAQNLGLIMAGAPRFLPATVSAVVKILELGIRNQNLEGKRVVVLGGGYEVGRPLVNWLSNHGATVLWGRSSAKESLREIVSWGEVLISAIGKPGLINGNEIREGAVVIDVGSPKGDVDLSDVDNRFSFVTPVPGGVGPVTVISLLENVVLAGERG